MIRKNAVRTTLVAAVMLVATAGAANAQLPETMKFTTTFPFEAGGTMLPAGSYTATPLPADPMIVEVSNGRNAALLLTEGDTPKVRPKQDGVTFLKRGDTYVLSEIWDAASGMG